jgi:hypothetical protein
MDLQKKSNLSTCSANTSADADNSSSTTTNFPSLSFSLERIKF